MKIHKLSEIFIVQEDAAERQKIRNVSRTFKQQEQQMTSMAVVSHEKDCDIFDCPAMTGKASFCFKPKSDRIVNESA